jgi:hypothetical protein
MSHAIRQDLSKLSKIIAFCLKTPSRGIHQSDEIINNPQTKKNKRGYKRSLFIRQGHSRRESQLPHHRNRG